MPLTESEDAFDAALSRAGEDFNFQGASYYSASRVAKALSIIPEALENWSRMPFSRTAPFHQLQYEIFRDNRNRLYFSDSNVLRIRRVLKMYPIVAEALQPSGRESIRPKKSSVRHSASRNGGPR
jgi:hypothetical protein